MNPDDEKSGIGSLSQYESDPIYFTNRHFWSFSISHCKLAPRNESPF